MTERDDSDDPMVVVCEGPPACPFMGDAAVENANSGCPRCRRIVVHPDGSTDEFRLAAN